MSIRDIAQKAGVAVSTVSKALRNRPGVNPKTRKEILRLARELNYRPDPFARTLVSRRTTQKPQFQAVLACLYGHTESNPMAYVPHYREIARGIREHADKLGYAIDFIWVHHPEFVSKPIPRILQSRGIPGIIFMSMDAGEVPVDWSPFCCAYASYAPQDSAENRFSYSQPDLYNLMWKLVQEATNRGYRRIGLALLNHHVGGRRESLGAYRSALEAAPKARQLPVHLWNRETMEQGAFLSWVEKHQPDLIISSETLHLAWLKEAGYRIPEDIGFLVQGIYGDDFAKEGLAGACFPYWEVGASAVDLVIGQIYRNERGTDKRFKGVLIEPFWIEGKSVVSKPA